MYCSYEHRKLWNSLRAKIKAKVVERLEHNARFGYSVGSLAAVLLWEVKPKHVDVDTALHNELEFCVIDILNELNKEGRLLIQGIEMDVMGQYAKVNFKLKVD